MESKKLNELATKLNPQITDITTIADPNTGELKKITFSQVSSLIVGSAYTIYNGDGSLSNNRTITMYNNYLTFTESLIQGYIPTGPMGMMGFFGL